MAEAEGSAGDRAYRRRFKRGSRREDYAVDLFEEARANLADVARVDRILLELGRYYNPLADGPIVDLATRRRVVELLQAGQAAEARALLDERLALYAPPDDPASGGASPADPGPD